MRKLTRGLLMLALSAMTAWSEDVIHLETLTPTAYRWTWTARGSRRQVLNTNLEGAPVRIAGKRYKRVIAGHSPMSYAWNLDGEALEFRAEVGMDDSSSLVDRKGAEESNVFAEVLVDRRQVFRHQLKPNQPAVPLTIDLRGRQQLELRATYGTKKFINQNIMWCNPVLVVKSEASCRRIAEKWSAATAEADRFAPVYPPAPAWQKIGIRKTTFGPFSNAYKITTSRQELVLVPELGGRILHYSRPGGANLLYVNLERKNLANAMVRGKANDFAGGHFQRFEPITYFFPADPILKHGRYRISFPKEGQVVMTSAFCPLFSLGYEYRLSIGEDRVDMENVLINMKQFDQPLSPWPITRVNPLEIKHIRLPDGTQLEQSKDFPTKPRKDKEIRKPMAQPAYELGLRDGGVWRFSFGPDTASEIHLYINHSMIEVESHGKGRQALPGSRVVHQESWSIR